MGLIFLIKVEKMTAKKICLGISAAMTLIIGTAFLGCASGAKINYYNFGDVSEENCALIEVSPVYDIFDSEKKEFLKSVLPNSNFVKIDGQGDEKLWQPPPEGLLKNRAIVRVTPGTHTFTITFYYNEKYEVPLDITYDCKAGKGYRFRFLIQERTPTGIIGTLGFYTTTIIIHEYDIDEKADFKFGTSNEVGKKTEFLNFNASDLGVDKGRLVERNK